jgi:hypothetical protein
MNLYSLLLNIAEQRTARMIACSSNQTLSSAVKRERNANSNLRAEQFKF